MTKIEIKESGEIKELSIIDPETGLDYSSEILGNEGVDPDKDTGLIIMTEEDYDWWKEELRLISLESEE